MEHTLWFALYEQLQSNITKKNRMLLQYIIYKLTQESV